MLHVKIFAFAVACMMVAPAADAQGNRGNSNGVPGRISNIQVIVDAVLAEIAALPNFTELQQHLTDLQTELATLQASLETATGDIANLISRVAALEAAGGGGASPVIWSGGCSTAGSGAPGAYVTYCADRFDYQNTEAHLAVAPSGQFSVITPGAYRISYWGVTVGATSGVRVLVNGNIVSTGLNTGTLTTTQRDQYADVTWRMNSGDSFQVQVLLGASGTNGYLPWRAPTASSGAQSRLQVTYVGP